MAKQPANTKAEMTETAEHRCVVVGWTHHDLGSSIDLHASKQSHGNSARRSVSAARDAI